MNLSRRRLLLRYVTELEKELHSAKEEIEHYQRAILQINRYYLDLAREFRRQLDDPDPDIRESLDGLIGDVHDHLARMEEFSG